MINNHSVNRQRILNINWKLIAMIEYLPGNTIKEGHYVSWIKNINDNIWIRIDDDYITNKSRVYQGLKNYTVLVYEHI